MAFFKKKKEEIRKGETTQEIAPNVMEQKPVPQKKEAMSVPKLRAGRNIASIIKKPRITEKAALAIDRNVYTFEVRKEATKHDVRDAVKELYNVVPVKVNMVTKKPRHHVSRMRGRDMMEKGLKKAYVYLKEGDRIDLA